MISKLKRYLPLMMIIVFIIIAYFSGLTDSVTLENWSKTEKPIKEFIKEHPYTSPFLFILAYMLYAASSLPGSFILSIIAGVLFPQPLSTLYVVIGATMGASLLFFAARSAARDYFQELSRPLLQKMKQGFQQDSANYMLFLRLVPIFPFFIVNIAPAILGVPYFTFLWTTFLGIIPASFVFTQAGQGLMMILAKMEGEPFSIKTIFNTQVNIALISLALLSLLPILLKKWRRRFKE